MTTIRRDTLPSDHFTIISNAWLRDTSLPWAARGLLAWMASHANGYEITEATIIAAGPSGRDAARAMIGSLEEAGYLRRERTPVVTGGSVVDYVLTDPRATENPSLGGDGKPVPRADQQGQFVSAAQPSDGKPVTRSLLEDQKKTKTPSVSTRAERATRIPDDFMPSEAMRAWFVAEKLGQVIDGAREHDQFMDYWRAVPGAAGRKLDWPATWRRWMRTAAERAGRRPGGALVPAGQNGSRSTTNDRVMQGLALVEKFRQMEEDNP